MTLQIEAGKYYRTLDGRKVGPMVKSSDLTRQYPWEVKDNRWCWDDSGRRFPCSNEPETDLIAEWTDEPAQPEPLDLAAIAKQHGIRITVTAGEMSITYDGRE